VKTVQLPTGSDGGGSQPPWRPAGAAPVTWGNDGVWSGQDSHRRLQGTSNPTDEERRLMPVHRGSDAKGPFYQWGGQGRKYRYVAGDAGSRTRAKHAAARQGQAAHAHGYRG
jgi:hypothetical protein